MKRNGWSVNLVFIALGAFFVASAGNAVVAHAVRAVPSVESLPAKPQTKAPRMNDSAAVSFEAMSVRNLLDAKRELPAAAVESAAPSEIDSSVIPTDLQKCSMAASLRATLVADSAPEWSIAVIYDNGSRDANAYSINEGHNQIGADTTLREIRSRAVVVFRNNQFELCYAEGEGGDAASTPARPTIASRATTSVEPRPTGATAIAANDGDVVASGGDDWQISRDYVDRQLENMAQVATQARIVPSFKNGKPNGFKLFSIKPGSLYSKIGLQNGDVLQKINGYEMNSPDKALEVYSKLKDSSDVTIELQRRGQNKTFNYKIR